ncbi:MAG TPA: adenylosuccinate synthetase, partial [Actinomycetota bacterium]|nr:adenylosuccinate synthetase [Actinomycetota bacterium]
CEVDRVIGVTKAYVTRVGSGPFPTEELGPAGTHMGQRGQEFGTTTGRPRRCGWFDAVLSRYAARLNGLSEIFLTKLDVLSGLSVLKVCTAYEFEGQLFEDFPPNQTIFHKASPRYEEVLGWSEDISRARRFADLPAAAQAYVRLIQDLGGVPVRHVSLGPDREQTLSP